MAEYALPDYVVQLGKDDENYVADFFVLPDIFTPICKIVAAPWYDAEEDNGKLMLQAFIAIEKTKRRKEEDSDDFESE